MLVEERFGVLVLFYAVFNSSVVFFSCALQHILAVRKIIVVLPRAFFTTDTRKTAFFCF